MKKSVLALLLVLVACAPAQTAPVNTDFRTGTQGLVFSFVPNLPPPTLYGTQPFVAMLQVENKGTFDMPSNQVFLSGFDRSIITGIASVSKSAPNLNGRGPYVSQGDITTVDFSGNVVYDSKIDYSFNLLATACYQYKTIGGAQVCIDPNPFAPVSTQKACVPSTVNTGSQGAPIAITRVEVEPAKGKTRFKVHVQNVGGGTVFKYDTMNLQKCSPFGAGLGFNDVDFVKVEDISVSGTALTCNPLSDGYLRLINGQAVLFCEYDTSTYGSSVFTAPLNIMLEYGYQQVISKQVSIKPSP